MYYILRTIRKNVSKLPALFMNCTELTVLEPEAKSFARKSKRNAFYRFNEVSNIQICFYLGSQRTHFSNVKKIPFEVVPLLTRLKTGL